MPVFIEILLLNAAVAAGAAGQRRRIRRADVLDIAPVRVVAALVTVSATARLDDRMTAVAASVGAGMTLLGQLAERNLTGHAAGTAATCAPALVVGACSAAGWLPG